MTVAARLRQLCDLAPPGTMILVDSLRAALEAEPGDGVGQGEAVEANTDAVRDVDSTPSWRERLWVVPAETRIGVAEVCEAFGRPKSWLYKHTSAKPNPTIPHRKFDGELRFVVGELRAWAREREDVVQAGPMESTAAERAGWRVQAGGRRRAS